MKGTRNLTLLIVGGIILILFVWGCSGYNGLVKRDETVKNKWSDVQSSYQRRADLIPNLVATVKGAAEFEKETYTQVALARAGQLKQAVKVPVDSLNTQRMQEIQKASKEALDATRMAINIAVERYPDLKATANFSGLQAQLEGTENRINVTRDDFNAAVNSYNTKVRSFPTNIFASIMGFKKREGFAAQPGSDKAPEVKF